jgi:hypothetical protein
MSQTSATRTSLGRPLSLTLTVAVVVSAGSWLLQLLAQFPIGSLGAGLSALGFILGSIVAVVPATVAIVRLIRHPAARSLRNVLLTAFGAIVSLPALLAGVVFLSGH